MIVFDLECRTGGHRFEGWFSSSDDYARQQERGLVSCPTCGSADVGKAVMAPAVARKSNQMPQIAPREPQAHQANPRPVPMSGADMPAPVASAPVLPPEAVAMFKALAVMQAEALKSSKWVGDNFAEDARAMHYGEKEVAPIHGQTTPEEAQELVDEGIEIAPLLFPVAPPGETN